MNRSEIKPARRTLFRHKSAAPTGEKLAGSSLSLAGALTFFRAAGPRLSLLFSRPPDTPHAPSSISQTRTQVRCLLRSDHPNSTCPTKRSSDLDGAAIPILSITWRSLLQRRR